MKVTAGFTTITFLHQIYHMPAINERNIAILCNALAGHGRAVAVANQIAARLSAEKISHRIFNDNWPPDFSFFTDIFITGGDGTLNYFVNHYPGIQLPLAMFKGGTGNDFHWLLYGNMSLQEQLELVLTTAARPVDTGKCNGRYFINGVGIGLEGAVVQTLQGKKKRPGKTSFLLSIIKNIFTYRSKTYRINSAEESFTGKKLLVDISNGRRAGGGFHIAPTAKADDGLLDVILADALTPLQRLRYLPVIEKGKHLSLPFIHHYLTKHISIECTETVPFHLDGEYFEAQRFEIEILPRFLNIRY